MLKCNGVALYRCRQTFRPLERAIAHPDIAHSPGAQRPRCAFAHFARAEKEHFALRQIAKNLDREINHYRRDRHRAARDLRPGAHLLRYLKGALKKTMQQRPGAPRFARERIGLLHLAEDFRLANDYGIQPAHDSEKMPHTFVPFVPIEPAAIFAGRRFCPRQTMRDLFRRDGFTRYAINLHAIARRQHQRLGATALRAERFLGLPWHVTLACLHVGGVMADADTEKMHCVGRPWEKNSIIHDTKTAASKTIGQRAAEKLAIHRYSGSVGSLNNTVSLMLPCPN